MNFPRHNIQKASDIAWHLCDIHGGIDCRNTTCSKCLFQSANKSEAEIIKNLSTILAILRMENSENSN